MDAALGSLESPKFGLKAFWKKAVASVSTVSHPGWRLTLHRGTGWQASSKDRNQQLSRLFIQMSLTHRKRSPCALWELFWFKEANPRANPRKKSKEGGKKRNSGKMRKSGIWVNCTQNNFFQNGLFWDQRWGGKTVMNVSKCGGLREMRGTLRVSAGHV